MARAKKIKIVMCGSCYEDFEETDVELVTMHINPDKNEHNGRYTKYLCDDCKKDPYFKEKIIKQN